MATKYLKSIAGNIVLTQNRKSFIINSRNISKLDFYRDKIDIEFYMEDFKEECSLNFKFVIDLLFEESDRLSSVSFDNNALITKILNPKFEIALFNGNNETPLVVHLRIYTRGI